MPILQKFCCCELRRGTIIFSAVLTVICFTDALICIHGLNKANTEEEDRIPGLREENNLYYSLNLGMCFFGFLVNGCLLYGAYMESRYFLVPWLVLKCLGVSILTIYSIILMFTFPIFFLILVFCCFFWYLWFCILSLYQSLDPRNPDHTIIRMTNQTPMNVATYSEPQPPPYGFGPPEVIKSPHPV